ncbi:unnamed protein product [Schistocephalus solidus]|uniref:DDE_Tnp_1_7 domain-containing protein n=1 Tax=Schistocephalus solidus TaxID=70667 RepID=A0A183TSK5_SCHSO|nr:unnamed protein product [Schistocephalus solidus]
MDPEHKKSEAEGEVRAEPQTHAVEPEPLSTLEEKKDYEEEEEEEEEEEDKIVEKSHNGRFHKRNKRFPKQVAGVDDTFIAIEPKSGKEVIWNERILPEKKTERELWRRHIGQLLSVVIFLHHLGVTHVVLDGFFGQRSLATDILALGLVALEVSDMKL